MSFGKKLEKALVYAAQVHGDHYRKGTDVPYITHLLAVAAIVGENGGTEDEVVAALLHDAPEDRGGEARLTDIRHRFGHAVAEIVAGCSDTYEDPKPPWRERKERHLAHLAGASEAVRLVSAADKLHNARSMLSDFRAAGEELWARFNGGREGTLWFYRAVVDTLRVEQNDPTVEEIGRVVSELERLAGGTRDLGP